MRTLVIAHGHPDAGVGGGEIAAYNLFRALADHPDVGSASFLARTGDETQALGSIVSWRPDEFVWRQHVADPMRLASGDEASVRNTFRAFLRDIAPDVVYVHHYVHLGLDILDEIRRTLPGARLILTLHDYVAICHHQGLMMKTGLSRTPCGRGGAEACHGCFPEQSPAAFDLRRRTILRHFDAVDRFVAPSHFLERRYVEWGLPAGRIAVVENGLEAMIPARREPSPLLRLGFFGQVRPAKGLDILLRALHLLDPTERAGIRLEVNGSRLEAQPAWYRELVNRLARPLRDEGTVLWPGPYARADLPERMARVDWVVVPSLWWENSPVVIQEAFLFGQPVIGARIGGIAEKVAEGRDGLLFEPGDPKALAELLRGILVAPERRDRLAAAIRPPSSAADMANDYLALAASPLSAPAPALGVERRLPGQLAQVVSA